MAWKQISEYASVYLKRHSYVNYDVDQECYFVDFYQDDNYVTSERYPGTTGIVDFFNVQICHRAFNLQVA